ncbi:MAG TPA: hypothetical protein VFP88_02240 [Rhodanobacteraceae bacterium]|nr:hypothetical protein [Rhodanobacteraceae bacterium]
MSEHLDHAFAAESPAMDVAAAGTGLPRIALLYADEALLVHVEQTLAAFRVPVVYRAAIAQADQSALIGAHPQIALINLDDHCGDQLDAVTAALNAAGIPVVFNDADISNGLEGWARARWARHLCAKLCGKNDVDPPRPAQATPARILTAIPATEVAEAKPVPAVVAAPPAMVAEITDELPAGEPASASLPLSQGEIDALVVDFPSETPAAAAGENTEEWSAQIDALLANAADSASNDPAPWEVVGFADETEQPAPTPASAAAAKAGAPAASAAPAKPAASAKPEAPVMPAVAARPAVPASIDQWQLVDDSTPVTPVAKSAAPVQSASFGSGLSLELEPLNPTESGQ